MHLQQSALQKNYQGQKLRSSMALRIFVQHF